MYRLLLPGQVPKNVTCSFDATAGDVVRAGGGTVDAAGMELAVGGRRASADTPVRPGDSVSQQPKALHG